MPEIEILQSAGTFFIATLLYTDMSLYLLSRTSYKLCLRTQKKTCKNQVWWHTTIILVLKKLKQKFQASLGYIVRLCLTKELSSWALEVAQCLKVMAALAEISGSAPRSHIRKLTSACNSNSKRSNASLSSRHIAGICHTQKHAGTHPYNIKQNKLIKKS